MASRLIWGLPRGEASREPPSCSFHGREGGEFRRASSLYHSEKTRRASKRWLRPGILLQPGPGSSWPRSSSCQAWPWVRLAKNFMIKFIVLCGSFLEPSPPPPPLCSSLLNVQIVSECCIPLHKLALKHMGKKKKDERSPVLAAGGKATRKEKLGTPLNWLQGRLPFCCMPAAHMMLVLVLLHTQAHMGEHPRCRRGVSFSPLRGGGSVFGGTTLSLRI